MAEILQRKIKHACKQCGAVCQYEGETTLVGANENFCSMKCGIKYQRENWKKMTDDGLYEIMLELYSYLQTEPGEKIYTLNGLLDAFSILPPAFKKDIKKERDNSDEIKDLYEAILSKLEDRITMKALTGDFNSTFAKHVMNNLHNWKNVGVGEEEDKEKGNSYTLIQNIYNAGQQSLVRNETKLLDSNKNLEDVQL